jgi:hypothetical protein
MIRKLLSLATRLIAPSEIRDAIKGQIDKVETEPLTGLQKFDYVRTYARNLLKKHSGIVADTLVQILVFLAKGKA